MIISVGYRVKSQKGADFRQWAICILRAHMTQGWPLNLQRFEADARELEAALTLVPKASQWPAVNWLGRTGDPCDWPGRLDTALAESDLSSKDAMICMIMNMLAGDKP